MKSSGIICENVHTHVRIVMQSSIENRVLISPDVVGVKKRQCGISPLLQDTKN